MAKRRKGLKKVQKMAELDAILEGRHFCYNCPAEITPADLEAGICTQCKAPLQDELITQLEMSLELLNEKKFSSGAISCSPEGSRVI